MIGWIGRLAFMIAEVAIGWEEERALLADEKRKALDAQHRARVDAIRRAREREAAVYGDAGQGVS